MASSACSDSLFGDLKAEQRKAVDDLLSGKDVLAVLPTGFGKSRIFQAFASIKGEEAVVLVIAPLQSIMKDQCDGMNAVGFPAADLSELTPQDIKDCGFSLLFSSAEGVLAQEFLDELKDSSSRLHQRLCCIVVDECHTVETWSGKRKKSKQQQPFRSAYGQLSRLRSICKEGVPLLALTATADRETQSVIRKELLMDEPSLIFVSPNRDNLRFCVMKTRKELMHTHLEWIVDMVKELGVDVPKTLIFCNTLKEVSVVVNHLIFKLGVYAYHPTSSTNREDLILGIYHSMSWQDNKDVILKSLRGNGKKRIIVATSALSMGVNFPDIRYILNWGPARSLLDQHQEAGRAGRDGQLSHVVIVYHGNQLANCEQDVKEFVKAEGCLRVAAYKPFDSNVKPLVPPHNCCSNCDGTCAFPFEVHCSSQEETSPPVTREVTEEDKACLAEAFTEVRESQPSGSSVFGSTTAHAFSDELITSITDNCHKLFTLTDIHSYLPVFSLKHAIEILEVLDETFSDIPNIDSLLLNISKQMELEQLTSPLDDSDFGEEEDTELLQMFQDELSFLTPEFFSNSDDEYEMDANV